MTTTSSDERVTYKSIVTGERGDVVWTEAPRGGFHSSLNGIPMSVYPQPDGRWRYHVGRADCTTDYVTSKEEAMRECVSVAKLRPGAARPENLS